jgi:nucleotide-binding universal stress UspA family protein
MFRNILMPVDGSELCNEVVRKACSFAKEAGARLTFYYAKTISFPPTADGEAPFYDPATVETMRAASERNAEAVLQAAAEAASEAGIAVDTESDESGSPYKGIIAAAERLGCDLIIMASHGRSSASILFLGSETQKVLAHCKIPVLVYRR